MPAWFAEKPQKRKFWGCFVMGGHVTLQNILRIVFKIVFYSVLGRSKQLLPTFKFQFC